MSLNEKLQFYIDVVGADKMSKEFQKLHAQAQELQKSLNLDIDPSTGKKYIPEKFGDQMVRHSGMQKEMLGVAQRDYRERIEGMTDQYERWVTAQGIGRDRKRQIDYVDSIKTGVNEDTKFGHHQYDRILDQMHQRNNDAQKSMQVALDKYNKMHLDKENAANEMLANFKQMHVDKVNRMVKGGAEYSKKIAQQELNAKKKAADEMKRAFQRMQDDKNRRLAIGETTYKNSLKRQADATKKTNDQIATHFKTGFSFHILQMYAFPILRKVNMMAKQTLTTFAEFDKKFADYVAKSSQYSSYISRTDFYKLAAGQAYSVSEAADAAERFAASGIDVAQSQLALQRALEVSKISGLNYKDAANGVIRTMQAMHLSIDDVTYITDSMVNAANASTAELKDMVGWFEYAASSAYTAGLSVQELSAMLGILSTTGMPNAGTAIRQMFMQFFKDDVRNKFRERFDWITDDMFYNIDELILGLRDYVQNSEDMARASREITALIGGKVTAQQSLNNLLVAEPHLWDQVTSAVTKTGTTAELYAQVTDNASDAMLRMRNSMQLMMAQVGEFLYPTLKIMDKILQTVVKVVSATPGPLKQLAGAFVFLGSIVASLAFGFMTLVGGMSIVQGVTLLLKTQMGAGAITAGGYKMALKALWAELVRVGGASNIAASSTQRLSLSFKGLTAAVSGLMGGMLGYYAAQSAVDNHMLAEARLVGHLTSLWVAYSAAKTVGLVTPWGALAGAGAFSASELLIQSKISEWEREQRMARQRNMLGGGTTYNVSMYDTVISNDGSDDFVSEMNRVLGV